MFDVLRAWDLAQEDFLVLKPEQSLSSAVELMLRSIEQGKPDCAIVLGENDRYLGTLSTHRILREIGKEITNLGAFSNSPKTNTSRAVQAACQIVGNESVKKYIYTKSLEIAPQTSLAELLKLFSDTTAHIAVVTEAGRALGILQLDDIFKNFAAEMLIGI